MKKIIAVCALALAVLIFASLAYAQKAGKVRRIGFLSVFSSSDLRSVQFHKAFRKGLRELGWVEGKNIHIEYRWMAGRRERLPALAKNLLSQKVEIIVVHGGKPAQIVQRMNKTIPIVMAEASEAVGRGIVKSLARPGGNITGLTSIQTDLAAKRLELLKEIVPSLSRLAVLWNPKGPASRHTWKGLKLLSRKLGIELHSMEAKSPDDFDKAFMNAARVGVDAITTTPAALFVINRHRIVKLAEKYRLPAIYHAIGFVKIGGLISYTRDTADLYHRAAAYVDKILKGAKPADLPVEQPTKFYLTINLKTAKALGITIPPGVLMQATRVIR